MRRRAGGGTSGAAPRRSSRSPGRSRQRDNRAGAWRQDAGLLSTHTGSHRKALGDEDGRDGPPFSGLDIENVPTTPEERESFSVSDEDVLKLAEWSLRHRGPLQ